MSLRTRSSLHMMGILALSRLDFALPDSAHIGKVGVTPLLCCCHIHFRPSLQTALFLTCCNKETLQENLNPQQGQVTPVGLYASMSKSASQAVQQSELASRRLSAVFTVPQSNSALQSPGLGPGFGFWVLGFGFTV